MHPWRFCIKVTEMKWYTLRMSLSCVIVGSMSKALLKVITKAHPITSITHSLPLLCFVLLAIHYQLCRLTYAITTSEITLFGSKWDYTLLGSP